MKSLSILTFLLAIVGCSSPKGYYQFSDLSILNVYQKEKKELYLEVWRGDSFTWIEDVEVVEKDNEIIIRVAYRLNDSGTKFIQNKNGYDIQMVFADERLLEMKIFYQDELGLHQLETKEWNEGLMEPYVIPPLSDPFEQPKAEPAAGGNG